MHSYITTYNHQHRAGVLIEFRCVDGFTFRTQEFQEFADDLAQHLVAAGKTHEPLIVQPYYKNPSKTAGARLVELHQALGVKVVVAGYVCFAS